MEGSNGSLPWILEPNEQRIVDVSFAPSSGGDAQSQLTAYYGTGIEQAEIFGYGKDFSGFSTGWYVLDDGVAYETTSNGNYVVDHHGDPDLYYYEPSGAHGLIGSSDPNGDFAVMRQYILTRAGAPIAVNGPFSFSESSTISTFDFATFTYFMCDFYIEPNVDVTRYAVSVGQVDDGIQVMLNGAILGYQKLSQNNRSWTLYDAQAGAINTLIVILADDSAVNKSISDLAFTFDGGMVQ